LTINSSTKRTLIYKELSVEDQKKFFDLKQKKFIHNIDSLYYVVKVKNDWNNDSRCQLLVSLLAEAKSKAIKTYDPINLSEGHSAFKDFTDFTMSGIGSKPYLYDIGKKDKFTCFIMHNQLNKKTPEIWVQIRAQYLWLYGEYRAVGESLQDLERLLKFFGIEIEEVKENRIDMAYHTNYIQDPMRFFKEEDLNRMQQSRFSRASKEYKFVGEFDIESDYITLGRKKSNNLFFRAYNKTKEVIEQGYKQFFIKLWFMEKMINYFDFYCVDKAFKNNSYKYLDVARLEFYLEFGADQRVKDKILKLINQESKDYDAIIAFANKIVPKVTLVTNIEIETKRKFYYTLDNAIDSLLKLKSDVPAYARKLYLKLDNKKVFHDYLTCNNSKADGVIRFLDYKATNRFGNPWTKKTKFPTAPWWQLLQKVKVNWKFEEENVQLVREYQKTLDIESLKKRVVNSISTYKVYLDHQHLESSFEEDVLDFISTINENDTEKAIQYKQKKFTQLKPRLDQLSKTDWERTFKLVDGETGEIFN
jgi:hypothetical protein